MAARASGSVGEPQDKDQTRLNQIISHFHTKAALAICSSRASLPQVKLQSGDIKQDRWFNLLLDETDILQDNLHEWRRLDQSRDPAPPLELEIFLDTAHLNSSQALVLVDDAGKRWDVADALVSPNASPLHSTKNGSRFCEVILERWTIQLGDARGFTNDQLNDLLPNIYKKGVVFFRSLFTFLRFLPAWKLYRKLSRQPGSHQALKLKFRMKQAAGSRRLDPFYTPLCASEHRSGTAVEHYEFPPLLTPSGPLRCTVGYRQNCAFNIADAESLLSSRFLSLEESIPTLAAGRSLPSQHLDQARERYSRTVAAGSSMAARDRPRGLLGAYGSLGTFHGTEKAGSPVSELRQRAEQADEEEAEDDIQSRRASLGMSRRISINLRDNPPFKAGSLASSPKPSPRPSPSPSTSAGRYEPSFLRTSSTPSAETPKRIPLGARSQPPLRSPSSMPNETAVASSGSASPRPAPVQYSSSFANRAHKRLTSYSGRTADSNASSARGSSSSKEKSDQLPESGMPGSSSAGGKSDDDDIAAFISQIESARGINSFRPSSRGSSSAGGGSASGAGPIDQQQLSPHQPHVVNLAKYSSLRDTNAALAEEMSASSLIQTSSTPPSRRLSNVPGLSTSSSPSRTQPTHLPHVRSRLSTNSIAEEIVPGRGRGGGGVGLSSAGASAEAIDSPAVPQVDEEDDEPFIFQQDNV